MMSFLYFLIFTPYHNLFLCLKCLKKNKSIFMKKNENNIFIVKKSFQIFRHFRHLGMLFDICFFNNLHHPLFQNLSKHIPLQILSVFAYEIDYRK